ncbi:rIIA protector from prophage-induced early lysis protein [Rhizobium phage RHph_Y2_17_1]|nr:rIIA protector from prophage-induced early lysis protein [Rhizobium phage RHph_Y2_11]QIG75860.1 rIIA protector from prophage-induced early lysis protein [Rhizobium phage RHph_Y2_17_1]
MLVSHVKEIDTHAVIGGGVARSFGMADSPEFFGVLSTALYRDGMRAMIREVICNGWDSHIKAGRTDKHVEITLTDDEIIFKDFGHGIPDELIVPVYCVYGASTKVKDENQTGGFGLGSKSPFAYTDHFTVDSRHAGLRNVYALSKGGASTEGRPEVRPMVENLPTDESGITVTIPLRNKEDRYELQRHIREVAYQGGMLVKLNGAEQERVDYQPARNQGFCAIRDRFGGMHESAVYLLYGTVLYPVTTTDREIYMAAKEASELIGDDFKLILIARPNTIGVTPSRESLNYTELTMATVLTLLKRATKAIKSAMPGAGKSFMMDLAINHDLTSAQEKQVKTCFPKGFTGLIQIDPRDIARHAVHKKPDRIDFQTRQKFLYDGLIKKHHDMRAVLRKAQHDGIAFERVRQRYDFRRVTKFASKLKLLDGAMIYDNNEEFGRDKRLTSLREGLNNEGAIEPIIFVAPNRRELTSMIVGSKADPLDRDKTFYVGLVVGSKPSKDLLNRITEAADAFKYEVESYDFEWVKPKVVRVKKQAGMKFHDLDYYEGDYRLVEPTLDKPKFFMWSSINSGSMKVGIDQHTRQILKSLYPGTAIVTTKDQFEKIGKIGATHVLNDVAARLRKLLKSREVQYGFLLTDRKFAPDKTYHGHEWKLGKTANTLANMHIEIAKLLFPDRVKLGSKWDEAKKLVHILRHFSTDQPGVELVDNQLPYHAVDELEAEARETFKDMIVPTPDFINDRSSLDYLEMMVDSRWIGDVRPRADQVERLVGVIRYLQRFGSKSKLTSSNSNVTLKEAA